MKSFLKFTVLALALTLFLASCSDDDDEDDMTPVEDTPQTIAEIASGDDQFSTLVELLTRADLVNTLNSEGTYTVFAPTNQAFDNALTALGLGSVDELEESLGTDGLRNVLLYHVIGVELMAADVNTGFVDMLGTHSSGANLDAYVVADDNGVSINDVANVTTADVDASNGVIHVVDAVLLPLDLVGLASLSPDHTALVSTLVATDSDGDGTAGDLVSVLSDTDTDYTVFAPVNEALAAVATTVATLTPAQVSSVLTYHVIPGANVTADQVTAGAVATANGQEITLGTTDGVTITDSNGATVNVVTTDIQGTNGVLHAIDGVLIPAL